MTSARNNIDISGDSSEILCTQEEAELWLCMLKEEYEHKDFILGSSSLNLTFVTKYKIQQLNKRFAGNDKPTNVLSFPASNELTGQEFLGDIAICSELIKEEAMSQEKDIKHHLIHIFVHGVLHLIGFDHEEEFSAAEMESLEVRILNKIGVADPY